MLWNAKNGRIQLDAAVMDYVTFGKGTDSFVMLPGLGDGLATVRGMAAVLALTYRIYAPHYRVYLFSRKDPLPAGYTTRDMARDQAEAMRRLGIARARVLGVSQGGMIAQYLAIDFPALVEKLVLAVTVPGPNETLRQAVEPWIAWAEQGDYKALMIDTAEKSYSDHYLKKYRLLYPLLGRLGRPKSFDRFLIQAASCLRHDAAAGLGQISCPTLVIGGGRDRIAGAASAAELARQIPGSKLFVYPTLGHALYEEAKDFDRRVLAFLQSS